MPYWPPEQTSFLKLKSYKLPWFKIENLWSALKTIQTKQLHGEIQSFSKEDDGEKKIKGPVRESNPGPLAPEARIMPLDQQAIFI